VFLDLTMPLMDGFEVARRIRAGGSHAVRIVAVSGCDAEEVRRACLATGMNGFLAKPFSVQEIAAVIRDTLHTRLGSA